MWYFDRFVITHHNKGMKQPYCSSCKTIKNLMPKPYSRGRGNGEYYRCRSCNAEHAARYRQTKRGKEAAYRAQASYYSRSKDKVMARAAVKRALVSGELLKPDNCTNCLVPARLDAHHDDYSKPLDVIWLCRTCHANRHKELAFDK